MAFGDNDAYARSIIVDLAKIRPLGDFVLIRPLSEDAQMEMEDRKIAKSPIHMTRDGRYRSSRPRGLRYGVVVACGPGDKGVVYECRCGNLFPVALSTREAQRHKLECAACGDAAEFHLHVNESDEAQIWRVPLGCRIGDMVIFPRIPANEITINDQEFIVAHEEQHIWGVMEPHFDNSGLGYDQVNRSIISRKNWERERNLEAA